MAYRATKSGLAAEAHSKVMSKYDPEQGEQMMCWIHAVIPEEKLDTRGDMKNVMDELHDGHILYLLGKKMGLPTKSVYEKKSTMAFKQMEKIGYFIEWAKAKENVPDHEMFSTVDLFESQNPNQVIIGVSSLARKAGEKGLPHYGPKEAKENKRDFSDEQLKAGAGIIGLQMGSNKGATQSGQSFGKGRMIVD